MVRVVAMHDVGTTIVPAEERMKITGIRLDRLVLPLEPAFAAAWDPVPRRSFAVTIVRVETDEGVVGVGSGDTMDGFAPYEHLFIGQDPLAIARHVRTIETIDFHAGALLAARGGALGHRRARSPGLPVATLFGGATDGMPAYASCGMLLAPAARAESAVRLRDEGFRALKIRIDPDPPRRGHRGRRATRRGHRRSRWRSWSTSTRAGGCPATSPAGARPHRRPADRRRLAESTSCGSRSRSRRRICAASPVAQGELGTRIAGGEMTRTLADLLAALDADAFDVYQPDVVLAAGMLRSRTIGELALARNRWFTPHTWTNGIGLLANLHVAAGVGGGPFIEFPYDPPGWTPERRDFMPRRTAPARRRRRPPRPGTGPGSASPWTSGRSSSYAA